MGALRQFQKCSQCGKVGHIAKVGRLHTQVGTTVGNRAERARQQARAQTQSQSQEEAVPGPVTPWKKPGQGKSQAQAGTLVAEKSLHAAAGSMDSSSGTALFSTRSSLVVPSPGDLGRSLFWTHVWQPSSWSSAPPPSCFWWWGSAPSPPRGALRIPMWMHAASS